MKTKTQTAISCAALCWALGAAAEGRTDTLEGFTEPYRQIDVAAGDPGLVTKVIVEPGQRVRRNDLLVMLDTDVLNATLEVARQRAKSTGAIDAARAEQLLRKQRALKIRALRARGYATERELARAEADLAIAEARLKSAEEEVILNELDCKRIQAQIDRRHVRSPIDAVVAEVHREPGEAFLITDPRLVTVVQLDQLLVKFPATAEQVAELREGQTVKLTLPDFSQSADGIVERISTVLDAKSGTLELTVMIANREESLRSGTRCLLEVATSSSDSPAATQPVTKKRARGLGW